MHKHAVLAWVLSYLIRKEKPLSYIETHAGRGLYDLDSQASQKTGEAAVGITALADRFAADHAYAQTIARIRHKHGATAYPGSPVIAAEILRPMDDIHLSELHPQEFAALSANMAAYGAVLRQKDGLATALSLAPPEPRRGLLLIDPSYEVKSEYQALPKFIAQVHRKWPVGVIMLWYPILTDNRHKPMLTALRKISDDATVHEVSFPPARKGHGMVGSGLFVINAPYGFDDAAKEVSDLFARLNAGPM